jgi:hypothetical protein
MLELMLGAGGGGRTRGQEHETSSSVFFRQRRERVPTDSFCV